MSARRPRVLILQHLSTDGPAFLGQWLSEHGVPFVARNTAAGHEYPETLAGFDAMAVLGGEMSANDPLPSLRQAEVLIREAVARNLPTLGHCLGGQLMARALGAEVRASPAPEVGWQPMQRAAHPLAVDWFGEGDAPCTVFQWHYESFDLPAGATLLASSTACPHQAFGIGPHLAMQFHIEVDAPKIAYWSGEDGEHVELATQLASVQTGQAMRDGVATHLAAHQRMAARIYSRWLSRCES